MNKIIVLLMLSTLALSACGKKDPNEGKFQATEQTVGVFKTSMKGIWAITGGCTTVFSMGSTESSSLRILISEDGTLAATLTTFKGNTTCQTKDAIIAEDNYIYNYVINMQISETESQVTLTSADPAVNGILSAVIKIKYLDSSKIKAAITATSITYQNNGKPISMDPNLLKNTVLNLNKIL